MLDGDDGRESIGMWGQNIENDNIINKHTIEGLYRRRRRRNMESICPNDKDVCNWNEFSGVKCRRREEEQDLEAEEKEEDGRGGCDLWMTQFRFLFFGPRHWEMKVLCAYDVSVTDFMYIYYFPSGDSITSLTSHRTQRGKADTERVSSNVYGKHEKRFEDQSFALLSTEWGYDATQINRIFLKFQEQC